MSNLRCRVGWHEWNKYGPMVSAYAGLCQFRVCNRCGLISYVKCYGNQATPDAVNGSIKSITSKEN